MQKKKKSIPKDGEKKSSKKSITIEQTVIDGKDGDNVQQLENVLTSPKRQSIETEDLAEPLKEMVEKRTSISQNKLEEKSSMDVINEIFKPPLKEFDTTKLYKAPDAVAAGDVNALQDLDERKIIELKEVLRLIYKVTLEFIFKNNFLVYIL